MAKKEIVTTLRVDGKKFDSGIDKARKGAVAFGAAATGLQAALAGVTKIAADFQDETIKAARIAGTTAEAFSGLRLAAEQGGVEVNLFRDSLAKLQEEGYRKKIEGLGIATTKVGGAARDSADIFKDLAEKIAATESPAEKTRLAVTALGGEGAKLINVLNNGAAGLDAFQAKAARLGVVVDTEAAQAAEAFNDRLNDLKQSLTGAATAIGNSLIAFDEQNSIIETATNIIADFTKYWNDLDKDTKDTVVTVVSAVTAIGSLAGAIALAIPIVQALNKAILANPIGLLIASIILLGVEVVKNFDKMQNVVQPLTDTFKDLAKQVGDVVDDLSSAADDLGTFGDNANDAGAEIDVMGTIAKNVFSAIVTALILAMTNFQNLISIVKLLTGVLVNTGKLLVSVFTLDIDGIKANWNALTDSVTDNVSAIVDRSIQAGKRIAKVWEDPIVVAKPDTRNLERAAGDAGASIREALDEDSRAGVNAAKKNLSELEQVLGKAGAAFFEKIEGYLGVLQTAAGAAADIADTIAEGIARDAEETIIKLQVVAAKAQAIYEKRREDIEQQQEDELTSLENHYDQQIAALENAEQRKIDIVKNAALERQLALDAEFQAEKDRRQRDFENYLESERAKFEFDKLLLEEKAIDEEQRKLTEQILENDYNLWVEAETARHEQELTNLTKEWTDKRREVDTKAKAQERKVADTTAEQIKAIELAKDQALEKTREDFLGTLTRLDEENEKRQSRLRKEQARAAYNRDLQVYNQTKATKIAEAITTGAAAAAQAFAQSVAAFAPLPIGIPIGGALAATILAGVGLRIDAINSSKPRKPAELRMAEGGVYSGPSHAAGGIRNVEFEGGEGTLDVGRTRKFINAADMFLAQADNLKQGRSVVVNIEEGAFQLNNVEAGPELAEQISTMIARQVESRVAV